MQTKYKVDLIKLRSILVLNQMNIVTLAKNVGVTKTTMYAVFAGRNPSYPVMCGITDTLKLSEEEAGQIFFCANLRNT